MFKCRFGLKKPNPAQKKKIVKPVFELLALKNVAEATLSPLAAS